MWRNRWTASSESTLTSQAGGQTDRHTRTHTHATIITNSLSSQHALSLKRNKQQQNCLCHSAIYPSVQGSRGNTTGKWPQALCSAQTVAGIRLAMPIITGLHTQHPGSLTQDSHWQMHPYDTRTHIKDAMPLLPRPRDVVLFPAEHYKDNPQMGLWGESPCTSTAQYTKKSFLSHTHAHTVFLGEFQLK